MLANLIASVALLLMMYLFVQELLNAVYPGLFNKLTWSLKKTLILSIKLALLPFVLMVKAWRNFRHPPFKEIHRYGPQHLHGGRGRG